MTQLTVGFRSFANAPKKNYGFTDIHRDVGMQQSRPPTGDATGIRLGCSVARELT